MACASRAGQRRALAQRIGEYRNIAVEAIARRRQREALVSIRPPVNGGARPRKKLGGHFRRHHGPTQVPAALDIQAQFQVEPGSFLQCAAVQLTPPRAAEHGAGGNSRIVSLLRPVGVHQEGATVALGFHLFEISGDGGFVGVSIQPPPVTSQTRLLRRVGKTCLERVAAGRARRRRNERSHQHRPAGQPPAEPGNRSGHASV